MRNSIFILLCSALLLGACKKDHTCTCSDSTGEIAHTFKYPKTKKKDAQEFCNKWNTALSAQGGKCNL